MGISFNSIAESIKESIDTKNAPAPIGTYSQAIKFGNSIYISGQIAVDPATGELVQGNFTNQIRQAFTNISEISKAAGGSIDDIVKLTIYLTELKNFAEVNEVMKEFFQQPYPARAVIEIKALPKNALVEIEAVMGKTV
ncbi:RidA family protein [Legionella nautarum]|nr:RidA family protein [Legionella nautarum]